MAIASPTGLCQHPRMPALQSLTPMLRTWDLPGTLDFYCHQLGFVVTSQSPAHGWARLARDGVALMVATPHAHAVATEAAFTGSLYFRVDDIDALWTALPPTRQVCYGPETFDYGMREFAIYDNNGYLLQFGAPVCAATDGDGDGDVAPAPVGNH